MSSAEPTPRLYPVALDVDADPRFTFGLLLAAAAVLTAHDYPTLSAGDLVALRQALYRFLYVGDR